MFAVIIIIIIVWIVMWGFYKFMYPRAPKSMMPKEGDVITPRACSYCGNHLAEYRGVLETKALETNAAAATEDSSTANGNSDADTALFFCNYDHQADFHAGKNYSAEG